MNDYERMAKAIDYVASCFAKQPTLEDVAAHVHLSPHHFQRVFSRWVGVTPKRFLQVLTVERAKALLDDAHTMLHVSDAVGLSSGSRLYDHFVNIEAVTPGEYKTQGMGLTIEFAAHDTPFGEILVAMTQRGICKLTFVGAQGLSQEVSDLVKVWPHARLVESTKHTAAVIQHIFHTDNVASRPLSLWVAGTNFQVNVWKALVRIPPGTVTSYSAVATAIGRPRAARAVGLAVGANPIALLIPCHRVIQQSGRLGGYRWGEPRKIAINAWEAARYDGYEERCAAIQTEKE